jgi:hypothetical protein
MIKLKNIIKESEMAVQKPKNPKMHDEAKRHFLEIISTYGSFRPKLQAEHDLAEVAETLGAIVDAAHTFTMKEMGEGYDGATVKRNMGDLTKLSKQFEKTALEAKQLQQRMHSMYEDMGYVLGKYFEMTDISEDEAQHRLGFRTNKIQQPEQSLSLKSAMPQQVSEEQGPCWKGYKQVGMKMKNGRQVPNCVPNESVVKENKSDCGCNENHDCGCGGHHKH